MPAFSCSCVHAHLLCLYASCWLQDGRTALTVAIQVGQVGLVPVTMSQVDKVSVLPPPLMAQLRV